MKGVHLLKEGLICRIGDWTEVNTWKDPWLNREGQRFPITPRRRRLLTRVCELINPETANWDRELVRNIFADADA